MAVKIRLARRGRKQRPFYHIVVADARAPRDGRFIEKLGSYNPLTVPATFELDTDRAYDWLSKGAQPTDTVRGILKLHGIYYRKHLMRGVAKGAFSEDDAMKMLNEWVEAKMESLAKVKSKTIEAEKAYHIKVSGTSKAPVVQAAATPEENAPAPVETKSFADSVEQTTVESLSAAPKVEEKKVEVPKEEAIDLGNEDEEEVIPVVAKETPKPVADVKPDDLKKIEGVGPKIAELLINGGYPTFKALSGASVESIKEILLAAGNRYKMHNPTTWPKQAELAAEGKWDELKKWQDELDGGKA